nr:unnamed protein product [Callosobruchus analis]
MKKYCIFIKESEIKDLSIEISKILPRYFKNHSYRLCFSNQILKDISDPERQNELIVHHHETKTCHRGINETLMALKRLYYWNNMQKWYQSTLITATYAKLRNMTGNLQK